MSDPRLERLEKAVRVLEGRLGERPEIALVLGSGFSEAFGFPGEGTRIPWSQIPGFPLPTVVGHAGEFWAGRVGKNGVLVQRGRTHYYEGYSLDDVTFSVRLFALLGVKTLIVTNASGAINPAFCAGDLVLLTDHINTVGLNPLRGPNLERLGPRFPDMSAAYSKRLQALALEVAKEQGIVLREGVYCMTCGPSYETPAEIRAYRVLGADLVGMSTVPEVIAAAHAGLEILGISCATNLAAGVNPDATLSHTEVVETLRRKGSEMRALLLGIIARV